MIDRKIKAEPTSQSRNSAFDIAKGLAIISIITYHSGFLPLQHQILPLITPWMILLFPIIAGFIRTERNQSSVRLDRKFQSIIFPYALFGMISLSGWLFLRTAYPVSTSLTLPISDSIWSLLLGQSLIFNGPLWFLPPYMIMYVLSNFYFLVFPRFSFVRTAVFSFLFILICTCMNPSQMKLPYSFDLGILFTGYYISGILINRLEKKYKIQSWFIIPILIVFIILAFINGTTVLFDRQYHNPFILYLTAITGTWIILQISGYAVSIKNTLVSLVEYAGKNSLTLFAVHWPLMQWITYIMFRMGVLNAVSGVPNHVTFSYYFPNAITFTLIEMVFLIFYTDLVFLFTWIISSIGAKLTQIKLNDK